MKRSTIVLITALVVSVAINLLILGTIIGHRAAHGGPMGPGRGGPHMGAPQMGGPTGPLDRVFRAVPEEIQELVRDKMRAERGEVRDQMDRIRDVRRAAAEALSARPFDPAKAEAALGAMRTELDAAQMRLHAAVIAAMSETQAAGRLPPPRDLPGRDGPPPGR